MENERKLAHIERITDLQPIEGADKNKHELKRVLTMLNIL